MIEAICTLIAVAVSSAGVDRSISHQGEGGGMKFFAARAARLAGHVVNNIEIVRTAEVGRHTPTRLFVAFFLVLCWQTYFA